MQALAQAEPPEGEKIFYDFEPHDQPCATTGCTEWIFWRELVWDVIPVIIKKPNGKDNAKRRFKCCCVCAEKEWRQICARARART